MFNVGDKVYFSYTSCGALVEHVGVVYCIIPAGVNINRSWFGEIVSPMAAVRTTDTYVVSVCGVLFLTNGLSFVPDGSTLDNGVVPFKKHRFYDRRDRMIIMALAKDMGDDYQVMPGGSLYVPAWHKRFVFKASDEVEHICRVEEVEGESDGMLIVK